MVIRIDPLYESLLYLLFPDYSPVEYIQQVSRFIVRRDVVSQKELLEVSRYKDCLVLSNVLFDEEWKEPELCALALRRRREWFGSRKRTLKELDGLQGEEFVDVVRSFLYTGELPLEEGDVLSVLDAIGSVAFCQAYLEVIDKFPESRVRATVLTFLSKVRAGTTDSLYYKRRRSQLLQVMERNMNAAMVGYARSRKETLDFVNFVVTLTSRQV